MDGKAISHSGDYLVLLTVILHLDFGVHKNLIWQYFCKAFWNRWTLGLDFGPGNAGLWTDISAQKHTKFADIYLTLDQN